MSIHSEPAEVTARGFENATCPAWSRALNSFQANRPRAWAGISGHMALHGFALGVRKAMVVQLAWPGHPQENYTYILCVR